MDSELKAAAAQPPHMELASAIESAQQVKHELAGLLANIVGQDLPDAEKDPCCGVPSLVEVLHHGPSSIHENTKQCLSIIQEIRSNLFL